ncbi:hypothetical protein KY363_03385 [Candidatus Woesearchaeota archaeon]|nr:hypothetical protein [Candidatus Woesearchaeota archaeon]
MVLKKSREFYHDGSLVGELFSDGYQFVAVLSSRGVHLKNRHYGLPKVGDVVTIVPSEFSDIAEAVREWYASKDALWGRRAHGSSWAGHTSTTFYEPHKKKGVKIEKGKSHKHLGVGKLEEKVQKGNLEFTFERFCLGIAKGNQATLLDEYQVPLLEQVFKLYEKRNGLYSPCNQDTLEGSLAWDEF